MKMNKNMGVFISTIFWAFIFCSLFAGEAQAAKIFSEPEKQEIQAGRKFKIEFFLDTRWKKVGAVEGRVLFPQDLLKLEQIYESNSVLGFWVESPKKAEEGIIFSGVIPGGFLGEKGSIFSLVFEAAKEGKGKIDMNEVNVLLNDGKGTSLSTVVSGTEVFVLPASEEVSVMNSEGLPLPPSDSVAPDPFSPEIAQDENVFDNQWFLSFLARDTGYGIDHYEVYETKKRYDEESIKEAEVDWNIAESPYLLKDQKLESYVFVKAVDKAGNETISIIQPQNRSLSNQDAILFFLSFMVLLIVVIFIIRRIKKKRSYEVQSPQNYN